MNNAVTSVPEPRNEPVRAYAAGSAERASIQARLAEMWDETIEIPAIIGGKEVYSGRTRAVVAPHEHAHRLGMLHLCGVADVEQAIRAALEAQKEWRALPWTERAAVFLRAAELLAGPWRDKLNAATMLGQSKTVHQAEIDSACELIDFLRFNVHFMERIYSEQPRSGAGTWNRLEYRPLEGFVLAVTPFNFTAIGGNLPTAPALLGNVVLWKPATTAALSAYWFYRLLEEAGLPPGVINFVPGNGPDVGGPCFAHPAFAGLHFTGSTSTFQHMWRTIGENIGTYRGYPRIVGETGGKDFIVVHASGDVQAAATAIVRGGFEYQGQKCSAASRVYVPDSRWGELRESLLGQMSELKMGDVRDFSNFVGAVIDDSSYRSIVGYLDAARADGVEVLHGGTYSDERGYFIDPTILQVEDPGYRTMCEEIFGPVVSLYVYPEHRFDEILETVDRTSPYALTGSIFARDRTVITKALTALEHAAGNFYVNDKPTGAVVGQQPFGGSRGSGTNDKAGAIYNLIRWVSVRTIKETFVPPMHFSYPFLQSESELSESADRGNGLPDATRRSTPS